MDLKALYKPFVINFIYADIGWIVISSRTSSSSSVWLVSRRHSCPAVLNHSPLLPSSHKTLSLSSASHTPAVLPSLLEHSYPSLFLSHPRRRKSPALKFLNSSALHSAFGRIPNGTTPCWPVLPPVQQKSQLYSGFPNWSSLGKTFPEVSHRLRLMVS